jgi:hypothetical protein
VSVTTQYSLRERNRFQEQRFLFGHGKDYGADIFKAAITLMANRGAHIGFGNALPARRAASWTNFPQCSSNVGCGLTMAASSSSVPPRKRQ